MIKEWKESESQDDVMARAFKGNFKPLIILIRRNTSEDHLDGYKPKELDYGENKDIHDVFKIEVMNVPDPILSRN